MRKFKLVSSLSLLLCTASLSACALPDAGPSANAVMKTQGVDIIKVTPSLVVDMSKRSELDRKQRIDSALNAIMGDGVMETHDHTLSPGDSIHVSLWTFAQAGGSTDDVSSGNGPTTSDVGTFEVGTDGSVNLPYVHKVRVSGMTIAHAQEIISRRFSGLGTMSNPAVSVTRTSDKSTSTDGPMDTDGVIVTGATGKPRILPWSAGGMTMARALTLAMGDGTTVMGQQSATAESNNESAISVIVSRNGQKIAMLPMAEALEGDIPLHPSDHLIVKKQSAVRVTVLGGGLTKPGLFGFADNPNLAQVVAQAQGLNPNTADNNQMFVFRYDPVNRKPTLYVFAMNEGTALIAAQAFPVYDNDVVYVAEAPIVPITRVLNMVFQFGVLASIAR